LAAWPPVPAAAEGAAQRGDDAPPGLRLLLVVRAIGGWAHVLDSTAE